MAVSRLFGIVGALATVLDVFSARGTEVLAG